MSETVFSQVLRERKLQENQTVVGLRESEQLIGQLYPVLVDEKGDVLDGQHRLKANPDWKKVVIAGVDSDRKKAMIRIHANWHRRKVNATDVLNELARITGWKGAAPYAAFLGCSVRTVQRYLPQQYKRRNRVPKRHVSLSEKKVLEPHELELRDTIEKQQIQEERQLSELHNDADSHRKECSKRAKIADYFHDLSDDEILVYAEKVNEEAKQRVIEVAVTVLATRLELSEIKEKAEIFKQKVEELFPKFKQLTVEFTDGSKLPLNIEKLPYPLTGVYTNNGKTQIYARDKKYVQQYVKDILLTAIVCDLLGFDEYGHAAEAKE